MLILSPKLAKDKTYIFSILVIEPTGTIDSLKTYIEKFKYSSTSRSHNYEARISKVRFPSPVLALQSMD